MGPRPAGAVPVEPGLVEFRVWAPAARAVRVRGARRRLEPDGDGVFARRRRARRATTTSSCSTAARRSPDPCSRWQPDGLRGPSRVLDTARFEIADRPGASPLEELVIYELHVGTFTRGGDVRRGDPAPRRAARARRDRDRADAGRDVPRRARLGLRRRLHLRAAPGVRRAGGARAPRRRRARGRARRCSSTSSTTTSAPAARRSRAFGPYFTDRHETFWGEAIDYAQRGVREWAIQNASCGCATTASTACGSTRCTRSSTTRRVHVLRELARARPTRRS